MTRLAGEKDAPPDGLVIRASHLVVDEAVDRMADALQARGLSIVARVDHAAAASAVDMLLPPTQVLIFANPRGGTPMMLKARTLAIDLPLKILVWKDEEGTTRIAYNSPSWLAARHRLSDSAAAIEAMADGLAHIVEAVAVPYDTVTDHLVAP